VLSESSDKSFLSVQHPFVVLSRHSNRCHFRATSMFSCLGVHKKLRYGKFFVVVKDELQSTVSK
jgi:hypothetical protein